MKPLHCANCGAKLHDAEFKNIDGDPCCKACWDAEERMLQLQDAAECSRSHC